MTDIRSEHVTAAKETVFYWVSDAEMPTDHTAILPDDTRVAQVTNFSGLAGGREMIDVTPYFRSDETPGTKEFELENWARVLKPSLTDNKTVTLELNFLNPDGGYINKLNVAEMYTDMLQNNWRWGVVQFPDPLYYRVLFIAFISNIEVTGPFDDIVRASISFGLTDRLIDVTHYQHT